MRRGLFSGWGGRQGARLHDAVRACAVAEARLSALRLRTGDWAGAHQAATRAEADAVLCGWDAMERAAMRMQERAVEAERLARAEAMGGYLVEWGLY